jgi:hypothetical protein
MYMFIKGRDLSTWGTNKDNYFFFRVWQAAMIFKGTVTPPEIEEKKKVFLYKFQK